MDAYFLYGANDEKLMVIRGQDENIMREIIDILSKARDNEIKRIAEILENHFNERHDNGGSPIKVRSKDKKISWISR
jgi:hypothetical protein